MPRSILTPIYRHLDLLRGLKDILHTPVSLADAESIVRHRLAQRETLFFKQLQEKIFDHPQSPYLPLLEEAQCSLNDIQSSLRKNGLESTLRQLKEAGVYMTFEEFKGRVSVKRGPLEYRVSPADFDPPGLRRCVTRSTSGSTGRGVRVTMSLDTIVATAPYQKIFETELGILDAPHLIWFQGFPGFLGPQIILRSLLVGAPVSQWFTPRDPETSKVGLKQHLFKKFFMGAMERQGAIVPNPRPVPAHRADIVASAIRQTLDTFDRCSLRTYVGLAVRTCSAARDLGLDLTGCTFLVGGEPVTPGKASVIRSVGGRIASGYAMTEASTIGMACLNPRDASDVHLFTDAYGLLQEKRKVPGWDRDIGAFSLTSLLPTAAKVMLNVEIDDYGIVEERSCGCPWERLGFRTHLRQIYSFDKLTGQGVTLVGSDALHVLEHVLPSRFGGGPQDFQLCETEDKGRTLIELVVAPHLDIPDEAVLLETFFQAITSPEVADPATANLWRDTESVRVVRRPPSGSSRGKLIPLHTGAIDANRPDSEHPSRDR